VVAIEDYPSKDDAAIGSRADANAVLRYLRDRGVDPSHIRTLFDHQATRSSIIDHYFTHLIDNDLIRENDPILIYFSGHGSTEKSEEQWMYDLSGDNVERLVPYDGVRADDSQTPPVDSIPDYTIGALLRTLAKRRGNNITVIFDCCHSGHMDRGGEANPDPSSELRFVNRRISPSRLKKLTPDLDREIWDTPDARELVDDKTRLRGGLFSRQHHSHVFLAACDREEPAQGNPRGGLFTRGLIAALRNLPNDDISYEKLRPCIVQHYSRIRQEEIDLIEEANSKQTDPTKMYGIPDVQTIQCEGVHRSRLLWNRSSGGPKSFTVQPHDTAPNGRHQCYIHAGEAQGVKVGTVFQLSKVVRGGDDAQLGSVIVTHTDSNSSLAGLPDQTVIDQDSVRAIMITPTSPLKYWIRNTQPESLPANTTAERLHMIFEDSESHSSSAVLASFPVAADIILEVDEHKVTLIRQGPHFSHSSIVSPYVNKSDIEQVFPQAFSSIARFHNLLSLANPDTTSPLRGQVDCRLFTLPEPDQWTLKDLRHPGVEIQPTHGEVVVRGLGEEEVYAIVLENRSDVHLFPHVMWFDPATYAIDTFWVPLNSEKVPLPAANENGPGKLQLGKSVECDNAMFFDIPEGLERDAGLVKVFLAEEVFGASKMEQGKVVGYTDNELNITAEGVSGTGEAVAHGGEELSLVRDTITMIVTIVPP
jgi:hypothetical protein